MIDRKVRQVIPRPTEGEANKSRPFLSFDHYKNIVLIGDPGAGKTHLFRETASAVKGLYLTTRDFLNRPTIDNDKSIFIDALDEKRAGRTDQNTIDAVVQKLFAVRPRAIRISCRISDWLGETDFAAFKPYFDASGDAIILQLEQLSTEEQQEVLQATGCKPQDIHLFLADAKSRGLEEFLINPQNLIMLHRTVQSGKWPESRRELFQLSTDILLREANTSHANSKSGMYTSEELYDTASGICAARLISGAEGLSLSTQSDNPDYPTYRSITFLEKEKIWAALGRRIFTANVPFDKVDYSHRTIAEFLSADWLAKRIRAGLPLGRVRALMGIDGKPAAELRGLHAWLAVFLPEHVNDFIDTDAYAVLTYGDVSSMSLTSRRHLLDALAQLSENDPWFLYGKWQTANLHGLSNKDMIDELRAALEAGPSNSCLKILVLDSLASGQSIPELVDATIRILYSNDERELSG